MTEPRFKFNAHECAGALSDLNPLLPALFTKLNLEKKP